MDAHLPGRACSLAQLALVFPIETRPSKAGRSNIFCSRRPIAQSTQVEVVVVRK